MRPEDYRGATIALTRSRVADATLRALGARGKEILPSDPIEGYDGVEQQIGAIAGNGYDSSASRLTANVTLWPRPLVLFANPKALKRLSGDQRDALQGGARAVLPAMLAAGEAEDKEAARILCRRGVKFVTATNADLAALRSAVQPVYDRLEQQAETKAAIASIRGLSTALAAPPDAPACSGSGAGSTASGQGTRLPGPRRWMASTD